MQALHSFKTKSDLLKGSSPSIGQLCSGNLTSAERLWINSTLKRRFNFIWSIIMVYQSVMIPIRIAAYQSTWDEDYILETLPYFTAIDILSEVFFIAEMFLRMNVFGFICTDAEEDAGTLILDPILIRDNYMYGRLRFDLLFLLPLEIISVATGVRTIALYRLTKMLRLLYISEILDHWKDELESLFVHIQSSQWRLWTHCVLYAMCAHWSACAWVYVGALQWDSDPGSWINFDNCRDCTLGRLYSRSFYSICSTLVTVGLGDIRPVSSLDTSVIFIIMLLGGLLATRLVAAFSSLFASHGKEKREHEHKVQSIRYYMKAKKIPDQLQSRILHYYSYLWNTQKGMDEKRVLENMPSHLRMETLVFLEADAISKVPFFKNVPKNLINAIAVSLKASMLSESSIIYKRGQPGESMFLINSGKAALLKGRDVKSGYKAVYKAGTFCGELSLFGENKREGTIVALTFCEVFELTRPLFISCLKSVYGSDWKTEMEKMAESANDHVKRQAKIQKMMGLDALGGDESNLSERKKMMLPTSNFRMVWTLLQSLMFAYLVIALPFRIGFLDDAFETATTTMWVFLAIDVVCDLFFLADIVLNARYFLLEKEIDGEKRIIKDPSELLAAYREGSLMATDIIASVPLDYIVAVLFGWQYFSMARLPRVLKLRHIGHNTERVGMWMASRHVNVNANLLRLVDMFLRFSLFAHWAGCFWFYVGHVGADNGDYTWIHFDDATTATLARQYTRSVYFACVIITTTGYGDIRAFTTAESAYAACLILFGGLFYYGSVGQISAIFTELSSRDREYQGKEDALYQYKKIQGLSPDLSDRLVGYYHYMWHRQKGVKDAEILGDLPQSLYKDISMHINMDIVTNMPLFADCSEDFIRTITSMFDYTNHVPGDVIFSAGDVSKELIILNKGRIELILQAEDGSTVPYGFLYDGNSWGEHYFLSKNSRSAISGKSVTFCDLSHLSSRSYSIAMMEHPSQKQIIRDNYVKLHADEKQKVVVLLKNLEKEKVVNMTSSEDEESAINIKKKKDASSLFSSRIFHPSDPRRTKWELIVLTVIMYYSIGIPLRICFPGIHSWGFFYFDYLVDTVFIIDIYLNYCRFAFVAFDGSVEANPEEIAKHYRKTRMVSDLVASLPLDILLAVPSMRTLQVAALLRLPKVIRLAQVPYLFERLRSFVRSSDLSINTNIIRLVQLFLTALAVSHWLGCAFYLISRLEDSEHDNWVEAYGIQNSPLATKYLRSFYWALSTLTVVCFGDITPKTTGETVFTMAVLLIGFFFIAALIGNIVFLMTNMDASAVALARKIQSFRQFCNRNVLPDTVRERVIKFQNHQHDVSHGIDSRAILHDLPQALRVQVTSEMNMKYLQQVPYFSVLDKPMVKQISEALKFQVCTSGEFICSKGDVGSKLFILIDGHAEVVSTLADTESQVLAWLVAHPKYMDSLDNEDAFSSSQSRSIRRQGSVHAAFAKKDPRRSLADKLRDLRVKSSRQNQSLMMTLGRLSENDPEDDSESDSEDRLGNSPFLQQVKGSADGGSTSSRDTDGSVDGPKSIPLPGTVFCEGEDTGSPLMDPALRRTLFTKNKNEIRAPITETNKALEHSTAQAVKNKSAPTTLAILEPCQVFGDLSFFLETRQNASVRSITPCQFLVLEKSKFRQLMVGLEEKEDEMKKMAVNISRQFHQRHRNIENNIQHSPKVRKMIGMKAKAVKEDKMKGGNGRILLRQLTKEWIKQNPIATDISKVTRLGTHHSSSNAGGEGPISARGNKFNRAVTPGNISAMGKESRMRLMDSSEKASLQVKSRQLKETAMATVVRNNTFSITAIADESDSSDSSDSDEGVNDVSNKGVIKPRGNNYLAKDKNPDNEILRSATFSSPTQFDPFLWVNSFSTVFWWNTTVWFIQVYNVLIAPFRLCLIREFLSGEDVSHDTLVVWFLVDYTLDILLLFDLRFRWSHPDGKLSTLSTLIGRSAIDKVGRVKSVNNASRVESQVDLSNSGSKFARHLDWAVAFIASFPWVIFLVPYLVGLDLESTLRVLIWIRMLKVLLFPRIANTIGPLQQAIVAWFDRTMNMQVSHAVRLIVFMIFFVCVGHIVGLLFYRIALDTASAEGSSWIISDHLLMEGGIYKKYQRSVYYAITAMTTVGYGDIRNENDSETVYVIFVIILSSSMFAGFAATHERIFEDTEKESEAFQELMMHTHQYMEFRNIPADLRERVTNYFYTQWSHFQGGDDSDQIKNLPLHLQTDIAMSTRFWILSNSDLFTGLDCSFIKSVSKRLQSRLFMEDDKIAMVGELSHEIFFIKSGTVQSIDPKGRAVSSYTEGDYFGESAVIANNATRRFTFIAESVCHICTLSRVDFDELMETYPEVKVEFNSRLCQSAYERGTLGAMLLEDGDSDSDDDLVEIDEEEEYYDDEEGEDDDFDDDDDDNDRYEFSSSIGGGGGYDLNEQLAEREKEAIRRDSVARENFQSGTFRGSIFGTNTFRDSIRGSVVYDDAPSRSRVNSVTSSLFGRESTVASRSRSGSVAESVAVDRIVGVLNDPVIVKLRDAYDVLKSNLKTKSHLLRRELEQLNLINYETGKSKVRAQELTGYAHNLATDVSQLRRDIRIMKLEINARAVDLAGDQNGSERGSYGSTMNSPRMQSRDSGAPLLVSRVSSSVDDSGQPAKRLTAFNRARSSAQGGPPTGKRVLSTRRGSVSSTSRVQTSSRFKQRSKQGSEEEDDNSSDSEALGIHSTSKSNSGSRFVSHRVSSSFNRSFSSKNNSNPPRLSNGSVTKTVPEDDETVNGTQKIKKRLTNGSDRSRRNTASNKRSSTRSLISSIRRQTQTQKSELTRTPSVDVMVASNPYLIGHARGRSNSISISEFVSFMEEEAKEVTRHTPMLRRNKSEAELKREEDLEALVEATEHLVQSSKRSSRYTLDKRGSMRLRSVFDR